MAPGPRPYPRHKHADNADLSAPLRNCGGVNSDRPGGQRRVGSVHVAAASASRATATNITVSQPKTTMLRGSEQISEGLFNTSLQRMAAKRATRSGIVARAVSIPMESALVRHCDAFSTLNRGHSPANALGGIRRRMFWLRHETREHPLAVLGAPRAACPRGFSAEELHPVPWPAEREPATRQTQFVQPDPV